jgi:PAS domain S-box-containing protein
MRGDEQFLQGLLGSPNLLEQVFDRLPDVLFFIKDMEARYVWVNKTLAERSGLHQRSAVVGKTADQLFPVSGATTYAQDMEVMRRQRAIEDRLRLYRSHQGELYWTLSSKFPIRNERREVIGLVGLSRDLPRSNERHRNYNRLARCLEYIDLRFDQQVLIPDAAKYASLTTNTLGRLVFEVFHLTPRQLLMKKRIDKACQLLEETTRSITEVSYACGYADHSAFTRQFRSATGITPVVYRATHKTSGSAAMLDA